MQDMSVFERNPMVYARAGDVNVYIKRNFAPLEDRVRSLVAIESQIPNILIAARTNLDEKLPKPFLELAIQIARGSADFLKKDLVAAVSGIKDEQLRIAFQVANRKAANALSDYATWLEREKLPKATLDFALGEEKFGRFLAQTELVNLPPQKLLDIGMAQLKAEQEAFAEAAKKIDPNKPAIEVFKQIQSEHPASDKLIPDISKDLDKIRKYVVSRRLVGIPSETRAKVKETPQYLRATSFASMDTPGPFEKRATEAYYYVTPTEEDWPEQEKQEWLTAFNYYTSDIVSIHEVYPGHYVAPMLGAFIFNEREVLVEHNAILAGEGDKALPARAPNQGQVCLARQLYAPCREAEREMRIGMPMRTVLITISEVSRPVV